MPAAGTFTVVTDVEVEGVAVSGRLTVKFQHGADYTSFGTGDLAILGRFARTGNQATAVSANYELELPTDVPAEGVAADSNVGYDLTWFTKDAKVTAQFLAQPAGTTVYLSALAAAPPGVPATPDYAADARAAADDAEAARVAAVAATASKVTRGELVLHVGDYGATGNGTTDDTTAIQTALTAARAAKARLRFGFGKTYIVSATLNPNGVRVEGFGATLKVKAGVTQSWNVLQPTGVCSVEELLIDLNKANTTNPANNAFGMGFYQFVAGGWSGVTVLRNLQVINGHQIGVRFGTTSAATDSLNVLISRARVENLTVDACNVGLWLQNTAGIAVNGPAITGSATQGIFDLFTRGTQITGGAVSNSGDHGIVTQYSHGFRCTGATVESSGNMGIVMGGGSTTLLQPRKFVISGCTSRGNTVHGISIDPTKTGAGTTVQPVHGVIQGNICEGNGSHGLYAHNAEHLSFIGNVSTGNTDGGLAMDSKGVTVHANTLTGNAYGLKFQGAVVGYGSHEIGRNSITGNTTANYSFSSNGADNTVLELSGTGAPAVAAPVGSTYHRTDGGAGTCLYVKESGGVTSSGWVAK